MENLLRKDAVVSCSPEGPTEINLGNGHTWMIKLTEKAILFNHDEFPELNVNDFAKAFIHILEKNFKIRFEIKMN